MFCGMITTDPVLQKFRAALIEFYGDRIERIVLDGSRARGDARPDSDYDIALFLKGPVDTWQVLDHIVDMQLAIREATDADMHTIPLSAECWA